MTRRSLMALALVMHVCSTLCVAADYEDKPPTLGRWKGCEPGTWILQRWVFRNHPVLEDRVEYRRTMLLGRAEENPLAGYASLDLVKSTSPDGPWTPAGGGMTLDWRENNQGFITQLPDETLTFEKGTALCEVYRVDKTDDWGRRVEDRWFDKESGLLLQFEVSFDGVDDYGNPRNWSHRIETVRLETRVLNGKRFEAAVQREPYRMGEKVPDGIQETVKSAEIPGEIVSITIWATRDTSRRPVIVKELIDWGVDRAALEKYFEEKRTAEMVKRQRKEEQRIQQEIQRKKDRERAIEEQKRFWNWAITEATSSDEETRSYAFKQMPWDGYRGVPEELREEVLRLARDAVDDESLPVRREAVLVLAWLKEPDSVELLSRMLEEDPDGAYRYVEALAGTGDPAAGEPLARALTHKDARVRLRAARYLLRFDEERARTALEDIASGTGDSYIRAEALERLAEKDDSRFRSALLAALWSKDEFLCSSACLQILRAERDLDPELTAAVLKLLDDDSWQVRLSAMLVLGEHKVEEAAPKLIEILQRDEPFLVKDEFFEAPMAFFVVNSLGSIGTPEGVDALFELLDDPDRRYFGVYGLLGCSDPRAAEFLWTLYRTGEFKVEQLSDVSHSALLKRIAQSGDENLLGKIRSYLENEALPPEKAALRQTIQDLETRLTQETNPQDN